MKLKSLLIIFLILGFFMAVTAVRPAAAFDAEVSIISAFDEVTKTLRSTTDGTYGPLRGDPNDHHFDNKAVLSDVNNEVQIDVSDYYRTMQYGDIILDYYKGGLVDKSGAEGVVTPTQALYHTVASTISNASPGGCDVLIERIAQMDQVTWVKVTVLNDEGTGPVFTWIKNGENDLGTLPLPNATVTPDLSSSALLVFSNSIYITVDSSTSEKVYSWLVDSQGDAITESGELSESAALSVDTDMMYDANFVIRYTDARSFGDTGADNKYWDGNYKDIAVKHAAYEPSLPGGLNPLTNYSEAGEYSILVPVYDDIDTTEALENVLSSAIVYYDGKVISIVGDPDDIGMKPASDPENTEHWITVNLDDSDPDFPTGDDVAKNWSFSNSEVVIVFDDTSDVDETITRVATAADGVGPRLVSAYVTYDEDNILILKFSEELDGDKINTNAVFPDIELLIPDYIDTIAINTEDATELIISMDGAVSSGQKVNLNPLTDNEMSIMDTNGNPAYSLAADVPVTEERIIDTVEVTDVAQGDPGTTTIKIVFDKSMKQAGDIDNSDAAQSKFYRVKLVPGLEEDTDNDGFAEIIDADLSADEVTVTITVKGAIESTAAEDLPEISIVDDIDGNEMMGGDPAEAPVRDSDKAARVPDDKVGPYLKSASFNYNPQNEKTVDDLIKEETLTLALYFSEEIVNSSAIGSHTFDNADWGIDCLAQAVNDGGAEDPNGVWRVVLTLNDYWAKNSQLPYVSPEFTGDPAIWIDAGDVGYMLDDAFNPANDAQYHVIIEDATPLWVTGSETADADGTAGVVDKITVSFGKRIAISTSKFDKEDKVVSINGDPNMVDDVKKVATNKIAILLDEDDRVIDTAWTPTVSFDLDDDTIIKDLKTTGVHMEADFSLTASDGVAPILENIETDNKLDSYDDKSDEVKNSYWVKVKLEFSEAMDPNIWKEPKYAWRYVDDGGGTTNVNAQTFLTSDSDPIGTTLMTCSGNRIALYFRLDNPVDNPEDEAIIDIRGKTDPQDPKYLYFDDLAGNAFAALSGVILEKGVPLGVWNVPSGVTIGVTPTMNAMRIYGTVTSDPNNSVLIEAGEVYAFSRDELFVLEDYLGGDGTEIDPNRGYFHIDATNAYGAASIIDGIYHIMVYGKESVSGSAHKGFEYGDPVILVVKTDTDDDGVDDWEIATTACLDNDDYSIAFDGGPTNLPKVHNIDLYEREVINLQTGWNLISTSISGAYVNSSLCALSGLDAGSYSGYMYAPDDILAGEGSLPAQNEVYELDDIADVLFTLSHPFFTGNIFYDPATNPIFPVEDQLADIGFNKTPVFCTGRGYYVYIKDVPTPVGETHEWKIVLFGKKVPGPEYKFKVENTYDLIGHWGNFAYRTYDGSTTLNTIKDSLPSTYDVEVIIDDIAGIGDENAINICGVNNDAVDMAVVSTFWNYPLVNYPASWYAALPDFSDLALIVPGGGYWILIDDDAANGPFFVSYMPKPVE